MNENAIATQGSALSPLEHTYLPGLAQGLGITLRHIFQPVVTREYPEFNPAPYRGFRGEHHLKTDANGDLKCVACFMCATACPAHCITIVAEEAPASCERDKRPKVFDIDMLRCIYCGYCEEACPCDAIELTENPYRVGTDRESFIYDKEKLRTNAYDPRRYSPGERQEAH